MLRFLATAMLAAFATAGDARAAPGDAATLAWLRGAAHRLAAPEPSPAELAPIVARLEGARVIGVGEVTHGTHEDQAFKAALIRELVKAGAVDVLALEANRAAGVGFDRYVRLGEGDPVALIQSPSFFRIWKGDEFAGLLTWLRAWNRANPARPVRIVGIDNQDGGVDAGLALDYLATRDPALAARLRPAFGTLIPSATNPHIQPYAWIQASRPGQLPAALAAAATLRDTFAAKRAEWGGDAGYAEAAYAATIAWQNLKQFELEVGVVPLDKLPVDYMGRRDRFMATNLPMLLRPGERAAFWAHDNHVMAALPDEIAAQGYSTIGVELRRALGAGYRAVGFTYSKAVVLTQKMIGTVIDSSKPRVDAPLPLRNDRPQDLGSVFAALPGDAWWLDLRPRPGDAVATRFLSAAMWRGWAGAAVDPERFQPESEWDRPPRNGDGFDVLVWFRTMTPQHRWPVAGARVTP